MAGLVWSPKAVDELEAICNYIAIDSEYYAHVFAKGVIEVVERLEMFPESGRTVPEYEQEDIREVIFQSYRVVYRVKPDVVEIVAIVHGARLIGSLQ
ncbi:MAG: type II toxin-antitoxin system RelE/ParE family toxin [Candidatus Methanoperedens sp.]|jgi:plasmid stabilization system protein ParE|nr:type II toxin-antitoxin system RelE/ParE family toxin [Candidatus Methanoperedens sp.]PKL52976.1 MAG: type II toxin-antitoxin system RelE/ParE family toxin [Candidatus Methanoperedenaceae archaeon HGW-Methanoperedenaceae-1]